MAFRVAFAVTIVAAIAGSLAQGSEVKIKADDLPKTVTAALHSRFPGLTIVSAAKETDAAGKIVFDVELKQKDRKYETDIKEDGGILEVEKEIASKNWSKDLRHTIAAKYPNSKITEVMEVDKVVGTAEVPDHLEITAETPDEKSIEVLTSLDGKSVRKSEQAASEPAGGDEKIKPQDLPAAVTEAVHKKYPHGEVTGAERGNEDGQQVFEASVKSENRNIDITFSPQGEVLSIEKTLLESERPAELKKSLMAKYPHATIKLVEEVWEKDKMTGYEATIVTSDKKRVEVDLDPKGKLIEDSK
jgi:uncharacterized membrane protein YkoI